MCIVVLHSSVTTQKYNRTTTSSADGAATYFLLLFELDDVVRSEKISFCVGHGTLETDIASHKDPLKSETMMEKAKP